MESNLGWVVQVKRWAPHVLVRRSEKINILDYEGGEDLKRA